MTQGQQDCSLPSTAQRINRIEVLDINSNWNRVNSIDSADIDIALSEYLGTAGLPIYYDLVANSLFLYPAPSSANATLTNGLKVYFDRPITEFTTASTTSSPGFSAPFHRVLSLAAALDFEKDPQKIQRFVAEKSRLIEGLRKFYSGRAIERRTILRPSAKKSWRQYE